MKLWISAEADIDVADKYRSVRQFIEQKVNEFLTTVCIENEFEKWAFIAIIRSDQGWGTEVVKQHKKRKVLEFRLKIDHGDFLQGDFEQCVNLMKDSLLCSVKKMGGLDISVSDRKKLISALESL